jgi:hypothetical protein
MCVDVVLMDAELKREWVCVFGGAEWEVVERKGVVGGGRKVSGFMNGAPRQPSRQAWLRHHRRHAARHVQEGSRCFRVKETMTTEPTVCHHRLHFGLTALTNGDISGINSPIH